MPECKAEPVPTQRCAHGLANLPAVVDVVEVVVVMAVLKVVDERIT